MHRRGILQTLIVLFVAIFLYQSSTFSENPESPTATFQSKVRIVLVDVVVTDGKRGPVDALGQEDFQIFEDGIPQVVASFEEHKEPTLANFKLPPLPENVFTNFPSVNPTDSVNVVLLDMLNTRMMDQAYVHNQIIHYLSNIPPGSRLAIFTLTSRLHMVHSFTGDTAQLLALLTDKKGAANPNISSLLPSEMENDSDQEANSQRLTTGESDMVIKTTTRQAFGMMQTLQLQQRIAITLGALQQLARYLAVIPGRKNVIWFAGSFPVSILPNMDLPDPFRDVKSYQQAVQQTSDLLTVGQVALYPISAEGLVGGVPGMSFRQADAIRAMNQIAMEQLAKDTGGQAFYNTNGLGNAMVTAIRYGAHYYTLSYKPPDQKMDGKFHRIKIKLRRHGYSLSYRRGYYAQDESAEQQMAAQNPIGDPLLPLMQFGAPDTLQIFYKARVAPSEKQPTINMTRTGGNTDMKGPFTRYDVDFALPVDALHLELLPNGSRHDNIELRLVAYDVNGKPLNVVVKNFDIALQPKAYAESLRAGVQLHEDIDVPIGKSYLSTGIYELASKQAGTLEISLDSTQNEGLR
jgi:VWFA-related protein